MLKLPHFIHENKTDDQKCRGLVAREDKGSGLLSAIRSISDLQCSVGAIRLQWF